MEPDRPAPPGPSAGCAALVCLLLLAIPFFSMRLAFTDAGNDPPSTTTRQAFDALATGFGPGFNGPLIVAATVPDGQQAAVEPLDAEVRRHPGRGLRHPGPVLARRATTR